jgi:O-antigen/teichoic acid export membrane protein
VSLPEEKRLSVEAAGDINVVVKGGAVQLAGQVSQRLLSFAFGAIFTRLLGASAYGLYRQVSQILANGSQIGLAGFNYGAMRFITSARARGDHGAVRGTLRTSLLASGLASSLAFVALLLLADPIAAAFGDNAEQEADFARLIRLGAAYVPLFALLQVMRYATQAYKTMVPSVIAGNIVQPIARFVLGIALLVAGFQVGGAVVGLTISVGIAAVVAAFFLRRMLTSEERAASRSPKPVPRSWGSRRSVWGSSCSAP